MIAMMRTRTIRIVAVVLVAMLGLTFAAGWDTAFLQQVWADQFREFGGCFGLVSDKPRATIP
jgi:hypothetical protein